MARRLSNRSVAGGLSRVQKRANFALPIRSRHRSIFKYGLIYFLNYIGSKKIYRSVSFFGGVAFCSMTLSMGVVEAFLAESNFSLMMLSWAVSASSMV